MTAGAWPRRTLASVIMPTYNKRDRLRAVLEAFALTPQGVPFEVVVTDDGSTDGTGAWLASCRLPFPLQVVRATHRGAAAARNLAAAQARGSWLVFSDDDMVPQRGFIAAHVRRLQTDPGWLYRGRRWAIPVDEVPAWLAEPVTPAALDRLWRKARMTVGEARARQALALPMHHAYRFVHTCTSNLSVSAGVFGALGGFDERFGTGWGGEDTDLGYRAEQRGWRLADAPDAVNCHLEHSRSSAEKFRRGLPNFQYLAAKHRDRGVAALVSYLESVVALGFSEDLFNEQEFVSEGGAP